jgi:hypothetical protein
MSWEGYVCKAWLKKDQKESIIKMNEDTYKLVDTPGQLDYIYTDETQTICNYTLIKIYRWSIIHTNLT